MKKICLIFSLLFCLSTCCIADDNVSTTTGDVWDNWTSTPQTYYGQDKGAVSEKEFDKAIETVKSRTESWGVKLRKKRQTPKGQSFTQGNEDTQEVEEATNKDTLPVICIPVNIDLGDGSILPVGHYQVQAQQEGDKTYIKFYQAQYVMAKIPATETEDDFGVEDLLFAQWFQEDDSTLKLIYGSVDLNAYTYLKIK